MGYRTKPKDLESEALFDPATFRDNYHATNYCETLMHYLKSVIGTGIFTLPYSFKTAGTVLGSITLFLTVFICCHTSYILVQCAQKFYYYSDKPTMNYSEVIDYAFTHGPECGQKYAKFISISVSITLFITYFGTCSVYALVASSNLRELILHFFEIDISDRLLLLFLLVPFLFIVWIPNFKKLAPVSFLANIFILISIIIIFYYYFKDMPNFSETNLININQLPHFLANALFAVEAIGIVLPLENNMKHPKKIIGFFGVLTVGSVICAIVYWAFGFFGYLRYRDETEGVIMLNLPNDEISGQIVKLLISLALFPAFALQMYVAVEIPWNLIKDRFKHQLLANYILRTIMCIAAIALAIGVPIIVPFMGIIGAFCFSILGVILPVLIEIAVLSEDGFGLCFWILWKNLLILLIGFFVLIFGTVTSTHSLIQGLGNVKEI